MVTKNWEEIVQSCDLQNWREALAAVLTYARPDEFAALCGKDTLQTGRHLFHCSHGCFPSSKLL